MLPGGQVAVTGICDVDTAAMRLPLTRLRGDISSVRVRIRLADNTIHSSLPSAREWRRIRATEKSVTRLPGLESSWTQSTTQRSRSVVSSAKRLKISTVYETWFGDDENRDRSTTEAAATAFQANYVAARDPAAPSSQRPAGRC